MLLRCGIWDEKAVRATISQNREHQRHRKGQLDGMVAYAEANACRRHIILEHFGDRDSSEAQECCDNCRAQPTAGVVTDVAQLGRPQRVALILLDALHRLKWEVGRGKLAQILKGSHAKDIREFGYDHFLYYGRLEVFSLKEIEGLIGQLIDKGYIKVVGGEYPILRLSPQGIAALQAKTAILLHLPRQVSPEAYKREKTEQSLARSENDRITTAVLECVRSLPGKLPRSGVAKILVGSASALVEEYHNHPLYNCLAGQGRSEVLVRVDELLACGRLSQNEYGKLILTGKTLSNLNKVRNLPETINTDSERSSDDAVTNFLSRPHPRRLVGPWSEGWALDFHSRFAGAEWNRSSIRRAGFSPEVPV